MSDIVAAPRADRRRFSLHPEEDLTETPPHRREVIYLETNIRRELPDPFVGANLGVYWVPGQFVKPWVGPDVLVSRHPLQQPPQRVYLVWEDGPLRFVAEVASERTRHTERPKRNTHYQIDLQVPEYLYIDLDRHQLELSRLRDGLYESVAAQNGRMHSEQLDLWFGWDPQQNFVRIWTAQGRMLPTAEELYEQAEHLRGQTEHLHEQVREAQARADALAAELARLRGATNGNVDDTRTE
jgi:Uma2 family endonuclease